MQFNLFLKDICLNDTLKESKYVTCCTADSQHIGDAGPQIVSRLMFESVQTPEGWYALTVKTKRSFIWEN